MNSFNISLTAAVCAGKFVSKEPTRYFLNGIYVEPSPDGGVLIVATDGRRLVVFHDRAGMVAEPVILRFHELRSAKPKRRGEMRLVGDAIPAKELFSAKVVEAISDSAEVRTTTPCEVIDGTYPDWRRVVPKIKGKATFAVFQPRYLGAYDGFPGASGISVRAVDPDGPALIEPISQPDNLPWFSALMPMRSGGPYLDGLPSWASAKEAA